MKPKSNKEPSPFERFQSFARTLIAVPKKELDKELAKYNKTKLSRLKRRQSR